MGRLIFGGADLSLFFFFKQKTAYEMRISDWSSDVCSSDLLKAEQNFDFATLTSTTGYINNKSPVFLIQSYNVGNPVAGQSAINFGLDQTAKTFSQELQLASDSSSPFSWIVGAFYYHDNTRIVTNVYGTCVGAVCAGAVPIETDGSQKTRSVSGYADGTYAITPTTRLTLGVRYTSDTKRIGGIATQIGRAHV